MQIKNNQKTLYRRVGEKVRYYSVKIYPTLFDDFVLIREYGSVKNCKPTGRVDEYFKVFENAVVRLTVLIKQKLKRGYIDEIQH